MDQFVVLLVVLANVPQDPPILAYVIPVVRPRDVQAILELLHSILRPNAALRGLRGVHPPFRLSLTPSLTRREPVVHQLLSVVVRFALGYVDVFQSINRFSSGPPQYSALLLVGLTPASSVLLARDG